MSVKVNITEEDGAFLGAFRIVRFQIYVAGTTPAQIQADPSANRDDITGWELQFVIRTKTEDTGTPVIVKDSVEGDLIIDDAAQGEAHCDLAIADTLSLHPGNYQHTLWRTDGDTDEVLTYGTWRFLEPARQT